MNIHCPSCNTDKPASAFYKRSEIGRGLSKLCIVCTNERSKRERPVKPKQSDKWVDWVMGGMSETDY